MKYRVENGQITMPVSELNRLNDEAEELQTTRELLEKERLDLDRAITEKTIVVFKERGRYGFGINLSPNYDLLNKGESKKYKEILQKDEQQKTESKFRKMSVAEFKGWKKK